MEKRATSLTEQITGELRRRIVSGELAEGATLRQERLAGELGVSRIPLREAIRHLEVEGLVVSVLHKGAVVSPLLPGELEELFGIRMQLEPWLLERAMPNVSEADLAVAEAVTDETAATGTPANWGDLNWRFHEALYRPSGSQVALKLLRSVHDRAQRYVNLQLVVSGGDIDSELSEHHAILAYVRLGDTTRAVDMLRRHLNRVSRTLLATLYRGPERLVGAG